MGLQTDAPASAWTESLLRRSCSPKRRLVLYVLLLVNREILFYFSMAEEKEIEVKFQELLNCGMFTHGKESCSLDKLSLS